jgi:hypothetical protein
VKATGEQRLSAVRSLTDFARSPSVPASDGVVGCQASLFIAMFERDYAEPLGFQLEYVQWLSHFTLPYPDITT